MAISRNLILLDADNIFWAISRWGKKSDLFVPQEALSLYNKVKDRLDAEIKDFRFSRQLSAIYIDPTDRCNANCPYCYIPAKIRTNGRSMTRKQLIFALNKIAKYFDRHKRKAVIVFHAAEPLLVKDIIFQGIEKFSTQFNFGLQTNATLLERDDIDFLKKHRVGVGISLDSDLPSLNNRLRRGWDSGGNFIKAVRAIEMFDGYEGFNVITTITKFNMMGLAGMVKFLHDKKVPCILMNPVRLTQASSRALKPDTMLMAKSFIKAVDKAIELSKKSDHRIIVANFTNVILAIVAPTARRLMCDISPCGGGRCFLTITASGEMIPCGEFIGLKNFSGGNIFKNSIEQAMASRPFKRIRERIVEKISECDICHFRNICGAPCPAELHNLRPLQKPFSSRSHPEERRQPRRGISASASINNGKRGFFNSLNLGTMYKKSVFCEFYIEIIKYAFKLIARGEEIYCFRQGGLNNLEYEYQLGRYK